LLGSGGGVPYHAAYMTRNRVSGGVFILLAWWGFGAGNCRPTATIMGMAVYRTR